MMKDTHLPKNLDQANRVFNWLQQIEAGVNNPKVKGSKQESMARMAERMMDAEIEVSTAIDEAMA